MTTLCSSTSIKWSLSTVCGILLIISALILRNISRAALNKVGFKGLESTRLQIIEDQTLVTSGVYGYIRHPLYLGDLLRNYGFVLVFSSLDGLMLMILANVFLIIRREEDMLLDAFGEEYRDYMWRTRRLIPFFY